MVGKTSMTMIRCKRRRAVGLLLLSILCALAIFMYMDITEIGPFKKEPLKFERFLEIVRRNVSISKVQYCNVENDLTIWSFNCKVKCPDFKISDTQKARNQAVLKCTNQTAVIEMRKVMEYMRVPHYSFNDSCLARVINQNCYGDYRVPNVLHYVLFKSQPLEFYNLLSIYSAYKKIKPCLIIIHSDFQMYGKYWIHLLQLVPIIIQVLLDPPTHIFSQKIQKVEHQSDWTRLLIMKEFGGIYVDTDEVFLQDVQRFRRHSFVLAYENSFSISNAVIFSERNPKFINMWQEAYFTFNPNVWGDHSVILPLRLSKIFPHLLHIEGLTAFLKPTAESGDFIFDTNFDWSKSYGIHLYVRNYKNTFNATIEELLNPTVVRTLNTTIGAVARYIMFDSKELCDK